MKNRHFLLIILLFLVLALIHYSEFLSIPGIQKVIPDPGFNRHSLLRILFLMPVFYASALFGLKGGIISLISSLLIMLPRVVLISEYPKDAAFETVTVFIIGTLILILLEARRRDRENIGLYAKQIEKAHEEERKRIARDLHDETVQSLIAVNRRLEALSSLCAGNNPEIDEDLGKIRNEIERTTASIRTYIQDLRPPVLELLGLLPALRDLCGGIERESGIRIILDCTDDLKLVDRDRERALSLYRIVQEALGNSRKHSGASEIRIEISIAGGAAELMIGDNGKGFPERDKSDLLRSGKLGIVGMMERASLLGGTLKLSSTETGTRIKIRVPLV